MKHFENLIRKSYACVLKWHTGWFWGLAWWRGFCRPARTGLYIEEATSGDDSPRLQDEQFLNRKQILACPCVVERNPIIRLHSNGTQEEQTSRLVVEEKKVNNTRWWATNVARFEGKASPGEGFWDHVRRFIDVGKDVFLDSESFQLRCFTTSNTNSDLPAWLSWALEDLPVFSALAPSSVEKRRSRQ